MPHITLKSIANNAEIDVIWEKWQATLEPLREKLNAALKQEWEEWEIPREADAKWPDAAKKLHADWWQARIARQKEIDASIAAKAEFEYLYDKPYEDNRKVRVAGPFTVESLSPHRVLGVDENDELIDRVVGGRARVRGEADVRPDDPREPQDRRRAAGAQGDRIAFTSLTPWPGDLRLRPRAATWKARAPGGGAARGDLHRPRVRHRQRARTWSRPRARRATPASTC